MEKKNNIVFAEYLVCKGNENFRICPNRYFVAGITSDGDIIEMSGMINITNMGNYIKGRFRYFTENEAFGAVCKLECNK